MKKRTLKVLAGIGGLGIAFCIALGTSAVAVSAETEYEYDDLNRLTEERHDDGTVIYYSYDANGNLLDVEVRDGNAEKDEDPDKNSDKNPAGNQNKDTDGNQDKDAGGKEGAGLGNRGNDDVTKQPGGSKSDDGVGNWDGSEGTAKNHGESGTENLTEGGRDGIGANIPEEGSGWQGSGEKDVFGNDGGNGTVIAKVLTVLVILIAALFGGIAFKKKERK